MVGDHSKQVLLYEDAEIKREYISNFYSTDKVMSIKMAPKVTDI